MKYCNDKISYKYSVYCDSWRSFNNDKSKICINIGSEIQTLFYKASELVINGFRREYISHMEAAEDKFEELTEIIKEQIEIIRMLGRDTADFTAEEIDDILFENFNFEEFLQPLLEGYRQILAGRACNEIISALKQASASQFSGGGFGFKGAVIGMASAAVLNGVKNTASSFYHQYRNVARYRKELRNFFENSHTIDYIAESILFWYEIVGIKCAGKVGIKWVQIKSEKKHTLLSILETFPDRLSSHYDKIITHDPYNVSVYCEMVRIAIKNGEHEIILSILNDSNYFGMAQSVFKYFLNYVEKMPGDNYNQLKEKNAILSGIKERFLNSIIKDEGYRYLGYDFAYEKAKFNKILENTTELLAKTDSPDRLIQKGIELVNNKKAYMALELFEKATLLGNEEGIYWQAVCYHTGYGQKKDPQKAIALFKQIANKYPMAYLKLGIIYSSDFAGEPIIPSAKKYFYQAVDKGIVDANYYLGELYIKEENWEKAHKCFLLAQKSTDSEIQDKAAVKIASIAARGMIKEKQPASTVEELKKLYDKGVIEAAFELGNVYLNGRGVQKDPKVALSYFFQLRQWEYKHKVPPEKQNGAIDFYMGLCHAEMGTQKKDGRPECLYHFDVAHRLGYKKAAIYYNHNLGKWKINSDFNEGLRILLSTGEKGFAESYYVIGKKYYLRGDFDKAFTYLEKAVSLGDHKSDLYIGQIYNDGKGSIEKNEDKAFKHFCAGAELNDKYCQYELSCMYYWGTQTMAPNYEESIRWANKSIQNGYKGCHYILGRCYELGQGVEVSLSKAAFEYEMALDSINGKVAKKRLKDIKRLQKNAASDNLTYKTTPPTPVQPPKPEPTKQQKEVINLPAKTEVAKNRQAQASYVKPESQSSGGKNPKVAAVLAFLFGGLGIHKFYMGKPVWGILHLLFCWTYIPTIISIIQGFIYCFLTQEEFDARCGKKKEISIQQPNISNTQPQSGAKFCSKCGKPLNAIGKCNFCDYK